MYCLPAMILVIIGVIQYPFAQAVCYRPPSEVCARLYEDSDCDGSRFTARPGINKRSVYESFDNKATSVVVRAGCKLTIYQGDNGGGVRTTLGPDRVSKKYDLREKDMYGHIYLGSWNNEISSVSCECPLTCQCGMANRARIIGGAEVNPKRKYPWQVGFQKPHPRPGWSYYFNCGGTIINDRWILTAAHCIVDKDTCEYNYDATTKIVVGEHKQFDNADDVSDTKKYSVKTWIKHPNYNCSSFDYDFALIELTEAISFDSLIRPICLPADDSNDYARDFGTTTGWGKTSNNGDSSKVLKELTVRIQPNNGCGIWNPLAAMKICAGGNIGEAVCRGDSGSGLYVVENGKYVLVGVNSYSSRTCDDTNYPGVYARVSYVLPWITNTASNGKKCD